MAATQAGPHIMQPHRPKEILPQAISHKALTNKTAFTMHSNIMLAAGKKTINQTKRKNQQSKNDDSSYAGSGNKQTFMVHLIPGSRILMPIQALHIAMPAHTREDLKTP